MPGLRSIPLWLFPVLSVLAACSTTRVLDEEEFLFVRNRVELDAPEDVDVRSTGKAVEKYVAQESNKKFLGLFPVGLWFYNLAGDSVPESGFRHWMKSSLGEPPVLFRSSQVEATEERIATVLENRGFFHYQIRSGQEVHGRKLTMVYHLDLDTPYVFQSIRYPEPVDTLTRLIHSFRENSLLRTGNRYTLSVLQRERKRITEILKRRGFYYFLPDHLYFRVDSISETRRMNVQVALRRDIPDEARKIQYIGDIFVHHAEAGGLEKEEGDTVAEEGILHLNPDGIRTKPRVVNRALLLKKGEPYDEQDYLRSLGRLNGLGAFRYVHIRYSAPDPPHGSVLDAHVFLTPADQYRLQAELQAVSKSNDFVGPGLNLSFVNRNLARNATALRLDIHSGFETQLNRDVRGVNSLEWGVSSEFDIPRILAPGLIADRFSSNPFTPRTKIRTGYSYFDRGDLFTVNSLNASYGFRWEQSAVHSNDLKIFSFDYLRLDNVSPELEGTSLLRRMYPEQFILLARHSFTLNDLAIQRFTNHYLHTSLESAGNLVSLADRVLKERSGEEGDPSTLLGVPYAQYARFTADYRIHLNLSSAQKLVGRVFAGTGIPYGNSRYMPYKKQFYSGGTTSLRGFRSRSVGPGSYFPDDSMEIGGFFERTGDIKLELNMEYRFDIYKFLKGALFFDAGNIWLISADREMPGGHFEPSRFAADLAASAGAGLRLDFSVAVLRLDVGFPLRKPYRVRRERWILDEIGFFRSDWRRENLVFNLAIGYPF